MMMNGDFAIEHPEKDIGLRQYWHVIRRRRWIFIATFIGQSVGWYRLDQGAGLIAATVGAVLVLFIWNRLVVHRVIRDPGNPAGPSASPPGRS